MPGPPPKPAARRQRGRRRNDFGLVRAASKPPTMPRGLCRQAQDAWSGYWTDVVSGVMRRSDAPIVLRWIKNLDRYHRLIGESTYFLTGTDEQLFEPLKGQALGVRVDASRLVPLES